MYKKPPSRAGGVEEKEQESQPRRAVIPQQAQGEASVRSRKQETERVLENQECWENKVQRSRRENKGRMQAQKIAEAPLSFLLPTLPAHPATTDQSDAVLHNLPIFI